MLHFKQLASFTVLYEFRLWIDIDHSKFQPRSVSSVRRAHRRQAELVSTNNISLVVHETL